jgi:hypothetical protein
MRSHRSRERLNIRVNCHQIRRFDAVKHHAVKDVGACAAHPNHFYMDWFARVILSIVLPIKLHHIAD